MYGAYLKESSLQKRERELAVLDHYLGPYDASLQRQGDTVAVCAVRLGGRRYA